MVARVDEAGGALAAGTYGVDIDGDGDGWVRVSGASRVVVVRLNAGLASDWAGLPGAIAGGIVRLAAHRFEARGGDAAPPAAVAALWRPWRRLRLAGVRA
ncbi:hypothetical protein [Sphingomonas sp. Y38-1Y]|uniref:hypothetical protein n=1 Tax=Sphingomonas sp. Y38-1Y TaxID=3078265 RepID=UPI0028E987A4|nr:hypothetical protein [Sphingomonas sp. Y38-1Y]